MNVAVGVLCLEEQDLRHDAVGHFVTHRTVEEHDALFEETTINIPAALASTALFDNHRNQAEADRIPVATRIRGCQWIHITSLSA